jgi:hypothetical protein
VEGDVGDPGMVGGTPPPVDPRYVTTSDFAVAVLRHDHGAWEGSATLYLDDGTADWLQWDGGRGRELPQRHGLEQLGPPPA